MEPTEPGRRLSTRTRTDQDGRSSASPSGPPDLERHAARPVVADVPADDALRSRRTGRPGGTPADRRCNSRRTAEGLLADVVRQRHVLEARRAKHARRPCRSPRRCRRRCRATGRRQRTPRRSRPGCRSRPAEAEDDLSASAVVGPRMSVKRSDGRSLFSASKAQSEGGGRAGGSGQARPTARRGG